MSEAKAAHQHSRVKAMLDPVGRWLIGQGWVRTRLRYIPPLKRNLGSGYAPRVGAWPATSVVVPASLQSSPGIVRDAKAEDAAFRAAPLRNLVTAFPEVLRAFVERNWDIYLTLGPRWSRAIAEAERSAGQPPAPNRTCDSASLTKTIKDHAAALGISAIGIARYDPRYTFAPSQFDDTWTADRVIVCLLETNYEATQSAPSARAEKAALSGNVTLLEMTSKLAAHLQSLGFHAAPTANSGFGVHINYAVAAGLGQLGMNGQLLTPIAGSRCRIFVVRTDAPLLLDEPKDYGVPRICDACKVCVRRCPPSAIPSRRRMHRGVDKAAIKLTRCWPTTVQAHGCAVCTKVCPVQKYGLLPVIDEYNRSGRILGKDSDELEGYDWVDGRHYGVGVRPKLDKSWFALAEFQTVTDDAAWRGSSEPPGQQAAGYLPSM